MVDGAAGPPVPETRPTPATGPVVVRGSASAAATAEADEEPSRTTYAYMQCPEAVVAGNEFELEVGLAPEAMPGVARGTLVRPAASIGPYFVTIQVVADGFALRDSEKWRRDLPVTVDAAYPRFLLHLTPEAQQDALRVRSIQAIYSVSGQSMGF